MDEVGGVGADVGVDAAGDRRRGRRAASRRRGQGPASIPVVDRRVGGDAAPATPCGPGGQRHRRLVAAPAARRGDQRRPLAGAEVDFQVGVGELGQVVEGRGQVAVAGVGVELAGDLDQDAAVGGLGDQVDRQQRAEGVVVRRGEVERAVAGSLRRRAVWTLKSPIFEALGQPAPGGVERRSRRRAGPGVQTPSPAPTEGLSVTPGAAARRSVAASARIARARVDEAGVFVGEPEDEAGGRGGLPDGELAFGSGSKRSDAQPSSGAGAPPESRFTRSRSRSPACQEPTAALKASGRRALGRQGEEGAAAVVERRADRASCTRRRRARPRSGNRRARRRGRRPRGRPRGVSSRPCERAAPAGRRSPRGRGGRRGAVGVDPPVEDAADRRRGRRRARARRRRRARGRRGRSGAVAAERRFAPPPCRPGSCRAALPRLARFVGGGAGVGERGGGAEQPGRGGVERAGPAAARSAARAGRPRRSPGRGRARGRAGRGASRPGSPAAPPSAQAAASKPAAPGRSTAARAPGERRRAAWRRGGGARVPRARGGGSGRSPPRSPAPRRAVAAPARGAACPRARARPGAALLRFCRGRLRLWRWWRWRLWRSARRRA